SGSAELRDAHAPLQPGPVRRGCAGRSETGIGDHGELRVSRRDARRDAAAQTAAEAASMRTPRSITVAMVLAAAISLGAQSRPLVAPQAEAIYQRLLPRISQIKIFDHHAHPGFAGDDEVDPAPVPPSATPFRLREENPDWVAAARALFAFPYSDLK